MQVEKAQEFLRSCCRVCLTVENEMVDTVNIVENFNKSIAQLLLECADIQVFASFYRHKNRSLVLIPYSVASYRTLRNISQR